MMAEEQKASAVFDELREMTDGGLAARRPNGGPHWGGHYTPVTGAVLHTGGQVIGGEQHPLSEYRRVEDVVLNMTPGMNRDLLLDTLRGIHEDILHKMIGGDDDA